MNKKLLRTSVSCVVAATFFSVAAMAMYSRSSYADEVTTVVVASDKFTEKLAQGFYTKKPILSISGAHMQDSSIKAVDDPTCSKCPDLTVGAVISAALNGSYDDERSLGWQVHFDRGMLIERIKTYDMVALDATEVALIERLLGKAASLGAIPNTILVQVIKELDPAAKAGKVQ